MRTQHAAPFPAGLGKPALRALTAAGLIDLHQIAARSDADLLALHGVGQKAVRLLREALAARGGTGERHG